MRTLIIISITLFISNITNAQTIVNSNVTGALENEGTIWLGAEHYITPNSSLALDVGYVFREALSNSELYPTTLTLDASKLNFKLDVGYKFYTGDKRRFYHGVNIGFKKYRYAGDVFVAQDWTDEYMNIETGSDLANNYFEWIVNSSNAQPVNGEIILQEVNQTRLSLQYMSGYQWRFNRISLDIFYQIGQEFTSNNMITGYRGVPNPDQPRNEKAPNGLERYSTFDLDLGIKVGYLLSK